MNDLKTAITAIEVAVAVAVLLVVGDYLGYKIGRWRLATYVGVIVLVLVVAFAIYAAVLLRS